MSPATKPHLPLPLRVDSERLAATLEKFAEFGATPRRGLNRLSLGDHDKEARDALVGIATERGYTTRVDSIGNVFVTRRGVRSDLPGILVGSHLDSQPLGGRFDGSYGVLAGVEALRSLDDAGVETYREITLVDWTNEEGSRFSPSMLGSSVFSGVLPLHEALDRRDADGVSVGQELERIGYAGPFDSRQLRFYHAVELHIEQGPTLEDEGIDIGVVTGTQGLRWYDVEIRGEARHAGTTPHPKRSDALLAGAQIIEMVDAIATSLVPDFRGTVGEIRVSPNSRNVIPGTVRLGLDFRNPNDDGLDQAERELVDGAERIAALTNTSIRVSSIFRAQPTSFAPSGMETIRREASRLGLSHREIASGANHDSMNLAHLGPASMIFIPCISGISHAEEEDIREEWAVNGANVLLNVVSSLASEGEIR